MIDKQRYLCSDEIVSIEDIGERQTYDFVVPGNHNFIANGFVVHNSGRIEEDSDFVILLHRKKDNSSDEATLIVAKHRQGGEHLEQKLMFDWRTQTYSEVE